MSVARTAEKNAINDGGANESPKTASRDSSDATDKATARTQDKGESASKPAMSERTDAGNNSAGKATSDKARVAEKPLKLPAIRRFIIPIFILFLAGGILFFITHNWNAWTGTQRIQKTDDAFLHSDITPLSTRISGTVLKV